MAMKAIKKPAKQPANKSVQSTKRATASAKMKTKKPLKTAKVKRAQSDTASTPNTNQAKPAAGGPTPRKKATTAVASMRPAAAKKPREATPQKKNAGKPTTVAKTTLSARAAWPFPTAAKP